LPQANAESRKARRRPRHQRLIRRRDGFGFEVVTDLYLQPDFGSVPSIGKAMLCRDGKQILRAKRCLKRFKAHFAFFSQQTPKVLAQQKNLNICEP
jgi:hypothetical protein